jgi:hypothetical protein
MYELVVIGNPVFHNGRLSGPSIHAAATASKIGFEQLAIVSVIDSKHTENFIKGIDSLGIPEYFIVEKNGSSVKEIRNPTVRNEGTLFGIPDRISIGDIPKEFLNAQAILLSPSLQEINAEFVEWICDSTEAMVYLDPQLRTITSSGRLEFIHDFSLTEKTQSYLDVIIPNRLESKLITGESDPFLAAELLVEWASETCVITLGEKGSLVYDGTDFSSIPSYQTRIIDSEGAGAVYLAAFASKSIAGSSSIESAIYASAVASLKVESHGMEFQINEKEILRRSEVISSSVETR